MWRYFVGAAGALLLAAAGLFFFRGSAEPETAAALPPPMPVETAEAEPPPLPKAAPRADDRTREQKRFDRYDRDRDESITREEYLRNRHRAYARLDTNGDGRLSFDEWAVRTTNKFEGADADRSGALSRAEFATTRVVRRPRASPTPCRCPAPDEEE